MNLRDIQEEKLKVNREFHQILQDAHINLV